jgi:hypothetical protein
MNPGTQRIAVVGAGVAGAMVPVGRGSLNSGSC